MDREGIFEILTVPQQIDTFLPKNGAVFLTAVTWFKPRTGPGRTKFQELGTRPGKQIKKILDRTLRTRPKKFPYLKLILEHNSK